jgi:hypothetical protein
MPALNASYDPPDLRSTAIRPRLGKVAVGEPIVDAMKPGKLDTIRAKTRKLGRFLPFGVVATSVAGVALVAMRGCWHRRMSWPVRMQAHSYQVCLECGVKRLFDEDRFCSYGPFRYDLAELIAWERAKHAEARALPHPQPGAAIIRSSKIAAS